MGDIPQLAGKRAVITGSASGIGRATAAKIASLGGQLTLADVDEDGVEESAKTASTQGATPLVAPTDVADTAAVQQPMERAAASMGGIDIVVNVAGVQLSSPVEETTEEDWERHFAVNVRSCFLTSKYAVPHLRRSEGRSTPCPAHPSTSSAASG